MDTGKGEATISELMERQVKIGWWYLLTGVVEIYDQRDGRVEELSLGAHFFLTTNENFFRMFS